MQISYTAVLLAAAAFYYVPVELLAAYIVACSIHELGHIAALRAYGVKVYSFCVELKGLVIEHEKIYSALAELFCALAGPVSGLVFSFLGSFVSMRADNKWFGMCAALSLVLSIFNLLPCQPLDGGRALRCLAGMALSEEKTKNLCVVVGFAVGCGLVCIGMLAHNYGRGYGALIAGVFILANILFEEGIVKKPVLR